MAKIFSSILLTLFTRLTQSSDHDLSFILTPDQAQTDYGSVELLKGEIVQSPSYEGDVKAWELRGEHTQQSDLQFGLQTNILASNKCGAVENFTCKVDAYRRTEESDIVFTVSSGNKYFTVFSDWDAKGIHMGNNNYKGGIFTYPECSETTQSLAILNNDYNGNVNKLFDGMELSDNWQVNWADLRTRLCGGNWKNCKRATDVRFGYTKPYTIGINNNIKNNKLTFEFYSENSYFECTFGDSFDKENDIQINFTPDWDSERWAIKSLEFGIDCNKEYPIQSTTISPTVEISIKPTAVTLNPIPIPTPNPQCIGKNGDDNAVINSCGQKCDNPFDCNDENCKIAVGGEEGGCEQCLETYFHYDRTTFCEKCTDVFPNCLKCEEGNGCVECKPGYEIVWSFTKCSKCVNWCRKIPTASPTKAPTVTCEPTPKPTPRTSPPTRLPTTPPTEPPTHIPSSSPTSAPTPYPTEAPTEAPTDAPTPSPTPAPTEAPTEAPTVVPTSPPTPSPTRTPSTAPTSMPTDSPTPSPTTAPTNAPTTTPTANPTPSPTSSPTQVPTIIPSSAPTPAPTDIPTRVPTTMPSETPTPAPTYSPTTAPTTIPSIAPTPAPTSSPTTVPTTMPTSVPTPTPTTAPTTVPTIVPSSAPTPTPTQAPTRVPTDVPSPSPTPAPTPSPTSVPTDSPSPSPSPAPTPTPTDIPTSTPTESPSPSPTPAPTDVPVAPPTSAPTVPPTPKPSCPTGEPTSKPTPRPTINYSNEVIKPCENENNECYCRQSPSHDAHRPGEKTDINCKTCPFTTGNVRCEECYEGYFQLAPNYQCYSCNTVFENKCKNCESGLGCKVCMPEYERYQDEQNGLYLCRSKETRRLVNRLNNDKSKIGDNNEQDEFLNGIKEDNDENGSNRKWWEKWSKIWNKFHHNGQ